MMLGRVSFLIVLFALVPPAVRAQSSEDEACLACHDDRSLTAVVEGREVSAYVDYGVYARSVHAGEGCVSCHWDVDPEDLPHEDDLERVECDVCHDQAVQKYERSLHGQAQQRGRMLAPTCETCHGRHDILASKDERAPTYVLNIPALCGSCHKEGTTVSELRTMSPGQRHVLEDYTESIHGEGLLRQGLIVTAVCTSCHTSHDILPHEHPESTIHREKVPETCMQCHRQVEDVHVKVINGELWEKRPHEIPVCVDCHRSHVFQRVFYDRGYPDDFCMGCHGRPDVSKVVDGETVSLQVDDAVIQHSAHQGIQCVKCHADVSVQKDPVCEDSGPVDCSMCHEAEVATFETGRHGTLLARGNEDVPYCTDCHGEHGMRSQAHPQSPTFVRNVPALCGRCHEDDGVAAQAGDGPIRHIVENYTMSIHGRGLIESGLLVTATCVDCHTAHRELPADDPASTVHPDQVAATCATCHAGVYEQFQRSVHSPLITETEAELPACDDCHDSHTITRVDEGGFRQQVLDQCGDCHEKVTESYFETFHGKVTKLGTEEAAKCHDCHGAHDILPASHPASTLSTENVVETCRQCHPKANPEFATYLTHADHDDREVYPYLFYSFWGMTGLLVFVFAFFGLHTLLWFPRELVERMRKRGRSKNAT